MLKKYKELVINTIIMGLNSLASTLITFICLPFLNKYLSTSEYGIIDLSHTLVILCVPVFTAAISDAVLRYGLIYLNNLSAIFKIGNRLVLISCCTMIPASILIAYFLGNIGLWKWILLFYIVIAYGNLLCAEMKSLNRVHIISLGSILSCIVTITLMYLTVVRFQMNVYGYFISMIVGNATSNLVLGFFFHKYKKQNYCEGYDKHIQKEMLAYSVPLIPNSVFWWANNGLDKICLKILDGIDIAGLYSSIGKIPSIINVFVSIFQQAWNISSIKSFRDKDDSFVRQISLIYTNILIVGTSWIVALLPLLTGIFYPGEYHKGIDLIPILSLSVFYSAKSSFIGSLYTAQGKSKLLFITTMIGTVCNVIGNLILIPIRGAMGAAFATCISNIIVFYIRLYKSKTDLNFKLNNLNNILEVVLILQCIVYSLNVYQSNWGQLIISVIITFVALYIEKNHIRLLVLWLKSHLYPKWKN